MNLLPSNTLFFLGKGVLYMLIMIYISFLCFKMKSQIGKWVKKIKTRLWYPDKQYKIGCDTPKELIEDNVGNVHKENG